MEHILSVERISKSFPGVLAVDDVTFNLRRGEIMALIGENGAGKSTLMQILGGGHRADTGQMYLDGEPLEFTSANDAIHAGIAMVFQELSLVGGLSIAENIFANRQPVGRLNNIHWRKLYQQTRDVLHRFNLDLDPTTPVKQLVMGQQQILEILKAITTEPKVLILDEPTSSLTPAETDNLFKNIQTLQKQGMTFIYISHKLAEVFELADRVMVMRDGKKIGIRDITEVDENDLVAMMVGREIVDVYGAPSYDSTMGEEYFRIEGFTYRNSFIDVSLGLHRGEILGLAGLVGAGRTELARSIFGIGPKNEGRVFLEGKNIEIKRPKDAIKQGIAYLTEDRKAQGLFLDMSLSENFIAPILKMFTGKAGFLNFDKVEAHAVNQIQNYNITTPSTKQKVMNLSGGNQQKSMVAMWMGLQPKVVIFDEPTRGVDVGARFEIYQKLRELASEGVGILLISSELPELIGLSDRILVMHQGHISGEVLQKDFSEKLILAYAAGVKN
ncbi:MAG: sugar ABC transporter ATP-binding protein [Anaerolineae bacterium]|nr:MAG: sugar ABC transporter ATP-binding protein [Anaerolineae bacterium]